MEPSLFITNKIGAPQGETLGRIKPLSRWSLKCSFNSFNSPSFILYGAIDIRRISGRPSIPESLSLSRGTPKKSSWKTFENSFTTETNWIRGISTLDLLTQTTWWTHPLETNFLGLRYKMEREIGTVELLFPLHNWFTEIWRFTTRAMKSIDA